MKTDKRYLALLIIGASIVLKVILCMATTGHPTDVGCFLSWSELVLEHGPQNFYTAGFFADYPPGGMVLLAFCGIINRALGITYSSGAMCIIALMAMIAEGTLAYLAYNTAKKYANEIFALLCCAFVAFSPALLYNTAVWKQLDSVTALFLVLTFLLIGKKKLYGASIIYAMALSFKPQALMLGPIFAIPFLIEIFNAKDKLKAILKTVACAAISVGVVIAISIPFMGGQSVLFAFEKLLSTAGSYQYATVNAANMFALIGANWAADSIVFGFMSYKYWGMLAIATITVATYYLVYMLNKKGKEIDYYLICALYIIAIFTFGHNMHERYMIIAIPFIVMSAAANGNIKTLVMSLLYSLVVLFNVALILYGALNDGYMYTTDFNVVLRLCAFLTVALFVYFAWYCCKLLITGKSNLMEATKVTVNKNSKDIQPMLGHVSKKLVFSKLDYILCISLTLVYFALILTNLGTTKVPQSFEMADGSAYVEFDEPKQISKIGYYAGINDTPATVYDENSNTVAELNIGYDNMFRWKYIDVDFTTSNLLFVGNQMWINELVLMDANGFIIQPSYSDNAGLFDEQDTANQFPDNKTGMYFDELYHGRTAYEYLHHLEPYENTHPPLGKLFIAAGIAIFGMNPFGWRIACAIFATMCVALMYIFAKKLLEKTWFAFLASFLFACDFMAFVHGRFATIDVFVLFFIIASYYFMYNYLTLDYKKAPIKQSYTQLALCGVCFGLAASCKWTGIYAGAGLAVLFFISVFTRLKEQKYSSYAKEDTIKTLLWCVVWFVIVPIIIYVTSYIISGDSLGIIWERQKNMLGYHSTLTDGHPFESKFWSWCFNIRPLWLYMGEFLPAGKYASVASFGNPIVWWSIFAGVVMLGITMIIKREFKAKFLLIAIAAQYVPWMFISRATFIYHYLATVPFAILALCYVLKLLYDGGYKAIKYIAITLGVLALACFVFFLPVTMGIPIGQSYAKMLMWLDTWGFFII